MGSISKNFSYSEFERTSYSEFQAQNHITTPEVRDNILSLVETVLQPLRDIVGKPLTVSSGYRCPGLNSRVGGKPTSQHLTGSAADILSDDPLGLARTAHDAKLPYDQMIVYNTFVHFSHRRNGEQRGQWLYDSKYTGPRALLQ